MAKLLRNLLGWEGRGRTSRALGQADARWLFEKRKRPVVSGETCGCRAHPARRKRSRKRRRDLRADRMPTRQRFWQARWGQSDPGVRGSAEPGTRGSKRARLFHRAGRRTRRPAADRYRTSAPAAACARHSARAWRDDRPPIQMPGFQLEVHDAEEHQQEHDAQGNSEQPKKHRHCRLLSVVGPSTEKSLPGSASGSQMRLGRSFARAVALRCGRRGHLSLGPPTDPKLPLTRCGSSFPRCLSVH